MSVVPKFVSRRINKELDRGHSFRSGIKAAGFVTFVSSVMSAGSWKEGTINWIGDVGGYTANTVEFVGSVLITGAEILWEGGGQAINSFDREFDGELPTIPSVDVSLTDSAPQQPTTETGYVIQPDDSYYRILGNLGMSSEDIAACDARVSLSNQPVLIAGQPFNNPC